MKVRVLFPETQEIREVDAVDYAEALRPAGWALMSGNLGEGGPMTGKGGESPRVIEATLAADAVRAEALKTPEGAPAPDSEAAQVAAARQEIEAAGGKVRKNATPAQVFKQLEALRSGKAAPEGEGE